MIVKLELLMTPALALFLAASGMTASVHAKPDASLTTTPAASVSDSSSSPPSYSCATSDFRGRCGPYDYPLVTGATQWGTPYVDQNVWGPIQGQTQKLHANDPGDWKIVSKVPVGNTSVTTFPNTGAGYNEAPLSSFSSIVSSYSETMPHVAGTSAWATYDLWFNNWSYEVMIEHDFVGNGPCDYVAVATFGGTNGVPSRLWGLCTYGSTLIWKLAAPGSTVGTNKTVNESSGSVDIKAMVMWLVEHDYMPADPTITNLSYGWEICSTGGVERTFAVSHYSMIATPVGSEVRDPAVGFTSAGRGVTEDTGVVALPVARSGNTAVPASVDYAATSGSATAGEDFILDAGTLDFAAGQTRKTIPVTITDDTAEEGAETLGVTLSPRSGTSLGSLASSTVTIRRSDQQPDGLISAVPTTGYTGDNTYNTTGTAQTRTVSARRARTRTFHIRIANDGRGTNTFRLEGTPPAPGSHVRYFSGGTEVTSAMRSSSGWPVAVASGDPKRIRMEVRVGRSAKIGSLRRGAVTASWTGDGTRADLVRGVVKVTR